LCSAGISLTLFSEGDSGVEISTKWHWSKRSITYAIRRLCSETMAYNPAFHAYRAIQNISFYAYSDIVENFVIVCFSVEKHYIPQY